MKNLFFSISFILSGFAFVNAQTNKITGSSTPIMGITNSTIQYADNMPNALSGKNYSFKYLGNNGNGFDFY